MLFEDGRADVVVVSYGITSRVARMGVELARKKGIKVGVMRLEIVWPFPEKRIRELASEVKAFVVPEINYGQMVLEIERCAAGGLVGVGELMPDGQGYRLDDEKAMAPIVEAALAHDMVLLTHCSEPVGHLYPGKGTVTPDEVIRFADFTGEIAEINADHMKLKVLVNIFGRETLVEMDFSQVAKL